MDTKPARRRLFNKKEWSWIMYDWANSIYATNIMAAIYPTIFASTVENGDIRWGYATSAATLIVAILAPILGAIADYKGMKKKLFTLFMLIGVVFTPLMVAFGNWKIALIGYVVSRIGFSGSCLFYDSFLTDVTTDERMDKVSSWGYAMGYIGGSTIPFVISIAILLLFDYSTFAQTFSVLIVSAWWLVFSFPMLKNVHQEHYEEKPERFSVGRIFSDVLRTFKKICTNRGLLFFVLAYFFYIDGVDTIISISTAYGSTLGLGSTGMIIALLVTQIVAMPCSIFFAKISEKFSARKALIGAVVIYLCVTLVGFYMGFSMEPEQEAYNKVFDEAYAGLDIKALSVGEDEALKIKNDFVSEYQSKKADDAAKDIAAMTKVYSPFSLESNAEAIGKHEKAYIETALADAYEANVDKAEAFRSAISFSSLLFWIMAVMVGTVQGGIQAVSRSYFGKLIPKDQSNEFYGFFDIFGKFAAFLGPFIYARIRSLNPGHPSYGVLGLSALFLVGLILLIVGKKHMNSTEHVK